MVVLLFFMRASFCGLTGNSLVKVGRINASSILATGDSSEICTVNQS